MIAPDSDSHAQPGSPLGPKPAWNLPNSLTLARIVLVPVLGWLLFESRDSMFSFWALVVFGLASLTDLIDGKLARSRGQITPFGELWDPIADKALTGVAFISLSMLSELAWWITIAIMVREVAITWLRFTVIDAGVVPANRGGKLKTAVQMISISMLLIAPAVNAWFGASFVSLWLLVSAVIVYIAVALTVVTGVDYIVSWRRLVAQLPGSR